ncbi:hypothetical protein [Mycolicibacterium brumae]|uniref:Uncharacterized protein n=1 Tax=Mycolicibacterium brumae TaxID=85968 RepID=A0A2G5PDN0_9MYCO|nr:hypothetical protein [Mycolicibacterium brumae]MCV7193623.1 hypothetical protein [Mycolicibacterium brumae]PIB76190.1 hypothetical protein CQY22_007395 [Mycolicibacterium brumae]RWA17322.1 hypothetical protein MBRU_06770 [Mycolicibacterium brumae DSM 44177]UWW09104.1 hypothetical protein L2Z93_002189 [Mycolicibacterium brumae]
MIVTEEAGTLADVARVRRELFSGKPPVWVTLWFLVPFGLFAASPWLSDLMGSWFSLLAVIVMLAWLGSMRLVCRDSPAGAVRGPRLYSRRAMRLGRLAYLVGWLVLSVPVVFVGTGSSVRYVAYPLAALLGAAWFRYSESLVVRLDPTGIDSPPLLEAPDQPPALDPLIEPVRQLRACAALAYAREVDSGAVAHLTGDVDVLACIPDMVAADYAATHDDGEQTWLSLTPQGRAAYRRHLRALGA